MLQLVKLLTICAVMLVIAKLGADWLQRARRNRL